MPSSPRQSGMSIIAIGIFVYLCFGAHHFLDHDNLTNIGLEMSFIAIPGVGVTVLFIVGEFDLSRSGAFSPLGGIVRHLHIELRTDAIAVALASRPAVSVLLSSV